MNDDDQITGEELEDESVAPYDIDEGLKKTGLYITDDPDANNTTPLGIGEQIDKAEIEEWES